MPAGLGVLPCASTFFSSVSLSDTLRRLDDRDKKLQKVYRPAQKYSSEAPCSQRKKSAQKRMWKAPQVRGTKRAFQPQRHLSPPLVQDSKVTSDLSRPPSSLRVSPDIQRSIPSRTGSSRCESRQRNPNNSLTQSSSPDNSNQILQRAGWLLWPRVWRNSMRVDNGSKYYDLFDDDNPSAVTSRVPSAGPRRVQGDIRAGEKALKHFNDFLIKKYRNIIRAWHALDDDGNMNLGEQEFKRGCERIGYHGNLKALWTFLDRDGSGGVSILELNPEPALELASFRMWCIQQFGKSSGVFKALDKKRTGQLTLPQFSAAIEALGFKATNVKSLFEMMDKDGLGFISADEIVFLDKWQPPEFLFYEPDPQATLDVKKSICSRFDRSPLRAWFRALDTDFSTKVCWREFEHACKTYAGSSLKIASMAGAWRDLDKDLSGWISLQEWDTLAFEALLLFKRWCINFFGSMKSALSAMDVSGDGLVSMKELQAFVRDSEVDLEVLFHGLDFDGSKFWSLRKLRFIDDWDLEGEFNADLAVRGSVLVCPLQRTVRSVMHAQRLSTFHEQDNSEMKVENAGENCQLMKDGIAEAQRFREFCLSSYKSIPRAWSVGDPRGRMHLSQTEFNSSIERLQYSGDVSLLWRFFNRNPDYKVSLLDIDPKSASEITTFKIWANQKFGEFLSQSFKVIDEDGSGSVDYDELQEALKKRGYTGSVEALFQLLDGDGEGSLTIDEIKRLDRWKPSPVLMAEEDPEILERLRELLYEGHDDEPLRAWMISLNRTRTMFINWRDFHRSVIPFAKKLRHMGEPDSLCAIAWRTLDVNLKGYISLKEFDEKTFAALSAFIKWAKKEFGSVANFYRSVDEDQSGRLDFREMVVAVGVALQRSDLEIVFHGLDTYGRGSLMEKDVTFLDHWDLEWTDVNKDLPTSTTET